ncbi:enoyl-CoA hydratase [Mycobacterium sp. djl-10]|nr:enoyl-CoA hydratase [Mycobacterium sp. djl-10]
MTDTPTRASEDVLVEHTGAIATLTINRPDRRNALTAPIKDALRDALASVADDDAVRAVILTGAGGHFCAGQDLAEHAAALRDDPDHAFDTVDQHYSPIVTSLATMAKPVIAAVEGVCVGAGLGFALACDLRIVSTGATLATAFSSIGLTCDSGLSHTLPRAVGEARARELILLAEPLSFDRAQALGLVTRPAEPGHALEAALALASWLADGPTRAYAESKQLLAGSHQRSLATNLAEEASAQNRAGATDDHRSAVTAFLAKAKPTFSGS